MNRAAKVLCLFAVLAIVAWGTAQQAKAGGQCPPSNPRCELGPIKP